MPKPGYKQTPEHLERRRQANLQPETREKRRQAALGNKNHLGHKHSPETREKLRQAALGNKNMVGLKRFAETREKMRQAALHRSPETREKHRQARLRQVLPTRDTSIECLLRDEFKKRRLHFEMHKTMFGRFQPDFVFESARLIVQADGDYWHSRLDKKAADSTFNKAAHDADWSVWRFGEKEIRMHPAACARAVARFVRDHP